ncbi:hypothetical protein [Streptomyces sp. E5N91]|uniref:hypothetical protein n=1 Tax=Streptomyces sp. E5N91 TaxID=1851996 RepID=UPI001EE94524|nr:hypothetical protein [Streptomyces sp. E5N91]
MPLGQAVHAAGGPVALADDPDAVRGTLHLMRQNLAAIQTPPVPRAFAALRALPQGLLVAVLRRFPKSPTAVHSGLNDPSPATAAELEQLTAPRVARSPSISTT